MHLFRVIFLFSYFNKKANKAVNRSYCYQSECFLQDNF